MVAAKDEPSNGVKSEPVERFDDLQPPRLDDEAIAAETLKAATEVVNDALSQRAHNQAVSVSILDSANALAQERAADQTQLNGHQLADHPFPTQKMDIHDSTGTVLQTFNENGESETIQPPQQQDDSQAPQTHSSAQPASRPSAAHTTQAIQSMQIAVQPAPMHPIDSATVKEASSSSRPAVGNTQVVKKPMRMPGTKQCPTCNATIAAAVAKCPKCAHVFREKKEKVKRSGKRGKKNCPKCSYENPSACSSCKKCQYVFRLKLIDKYRNMRKAASAQQPSETAAAAAAAAAHAAANIESQHATVTAVSTVPMAAGVASYPNQIAPGIHSTDGNATVMNPIPQHTISMPLTHQVHATTSVAQIHAIPQPLQQQQQPPQL